MVQIFWLQNKSDKECTGVQIEKYNLKIKSFIYIFNLKYYISKLIFDKNQKKNNFLVLWIFQTNNNLKILFNQNQSFKNIKIIGRISSVSHFRSS